MYFSDPTIYNSRIWDFDLLYSDDKDAVDAFYQNREELKVIREKRRAFQHIKFAIFVKNESKWEDYFDTESPTPQTSLQISSKHSMYREKRWKATERYLQTWRNDIRLQL